MGAAHQRTNKCNCLFWDFMHLRVFYPISGAGFGFDTTVASVYDNISSRAWSYAELTSPPYWPRTFYATRKITEVITWFISTGPGWTQQYQTTVTTQTYYPWFRNPCDTEQVGANIPDSVTNGTPSYTTTNSTDYTQDLRCVGFPAGEPDFTQEIVITTDYNPSMGAFPGAETSAYWQPDVYSEAMSITLTKLTQTFNGPSGPPPPNSQPAGYLTKYNAISRTTEFLTPVNPSTVIATMLAFIEGSGAIPLSVGGNVNTREGALNFDYYRSSCARSNLSNAAAGKTYGRDGTCAITVPANQLMGFQCGANDGPVGSGYRDPIPVVFGADSTTFNWNIGNVVWPYLWQDGTTTSPYLPSTTYASLPGLPFASPATTEVRMPDWENNYSTNASLAATYPDTCSFVSKNGSATLHGGGWHALPQWGAGSGAPRTIGDIITNTPNWGSGIADWLQLKCTAVTGDAMSSTEPAWGTPSVGATFTETTGTGSVTWTVLAAGAPVTALVTQASTNRLLVFPLRAATVITAEFGNNLYPGEYGPRFGGSWAGDSGGTPNGLDAFQMAAVRFRAPKPVETASDPTRFQDLGFSGGGSFPFAHDTESNLQTEALNDPGNLNSWAWYQFKIITPGEWIIVPGQMNSPIAGFGFNLFHPIGSETASASPGIGSTGSISSLGAVGGSSTSDL